MGIMVKPPTEAGSIFIWLDKPFVGLFKDLQYLWGSFSVISGQLSVTSN